MATTQNTFTGDGSTTNYSFTFEYIKEADVKATLNGTATTAFTLANATTLSFNTAPANGVAIRIFRDTDINSLKATFFPGSAIKAEDLNDNFTQNNFAVQEADFNVDTANATADTAKTNSETAVTTANTASTNATAAVATANTADTNASAAVATANTASTNASNAVTTANTASATANAADANATTALNNSRVSDGQGGFISAITKANTAVTTANTAATDATTAVNTANAATTTANTASTNASNAVTTANSAASDATSAVSTANTASTNASNAVTTANSAASDATSAVATANTASTNASNAVTTANTASTNATAALNNSRESDGQGGFTSAITKANTAITTANAASNAVSNAVLFDLVTNVSSIPGSPSNNDYIEIGNSTGIESFTPLSGLPSGFVGAAGLTVRLRYDSSATSWVFMNYFANDSETRYVAIGNPNPVYYANQAAFPSAATYHGGIAHSHADGAMYYAHGGNWIKMASDSDVAAKLPLAGGTLTGDLSLGDNNKLNVGTGNDLEIYHDGTNSRIHDTGTGGLILQGDTQINLQSASNENYIECVSDGAVTVYHDNNAKLATKSDGIDVTGEVQCDSLDVDGNADISGDCDFANNKVKAFTSSGHGVVRLFNTGNTQTIQLDGTNGDGWFSNNVGIGQSNPQNRLHISSSGANPAYLHSTNASSGSAANNGIVMGLGNATDAYYWNYMNGAQIWGNSAAEKMRLDSSGKLGIGTTTLPATLNVYGAESATLYQNSNTGSGSGNGAFVGNWGSSDLYIWNYEASTIQFGTNDTERFRIDSAGNIGIGTNAPSAKLDVEGSVEINRMSFPTGTNAYRNLKMQSTDANTSDIGVSFYSGDGNWAGQFYASSYSGSEAYGFLNANWNSWDIKKHLNGQLEIYVGGTAYTAYHTGNLPFANQSQAETGTDNSTVMTPLRVAQAIAAQGGSVINSIQRGTTWAVHWPYSGTQNATITSVNTAKTFVNYNGQTTTAQNTNQAFAKFQLTSSTNIAVTGSQMTTTSPYVSWEVVEFT